MRSCILIPVVLILFTIPCAGQHSLVDSSLFDPHVSISFAWQTPGGDLSARFGNALNAGVGFHIKSKTNWYYGIQGSYFFGSHVNEPGLISNLLTDAGEVLDDQGQVSVLAIQERGYLVTLDGGRLFPVIGPNRNSGILITAGVGFLQHKIRLEHQENTIPQLENDYLKGYDRLVNGLAISQFCGYYHMSPNRLANFFIGAEVYEGFTRGRRDLYYDTGESGTAPRFDLIAGIRAGWTLHFYRRPPEVHYFD